METNLAQIFKAILLGIVEGITEWLPISSTGHMILVDKFLQLSMSEAFEEMFFVVIQLGAILAVVLLRWDKLSPFTMKDGPTIKKETLSVWIKVVVACIPSGIYGITLDDKLNDIFYNYQIVAAMLILFGILFIVVENVLKDKKPKVTRITNISYRMAFIIGIAQLVAAVFPGTSRSGATILCGFILGLSRSAAAEFTFFLAIPTMIGASTLKLLEFEFNFSGTEAFILLIGITTAFLISIMAIQFLIGYIKRYDFRAFGWYRIALGICSLLCHPA